jgi:2-keto-4-pentenoate hydratase
LNRPAELIDNELLVAEAFVAARRAARPLSAYPGTRPADLAASYRIQDAALALDGRPVGAWKVGRINPPFDRELGEDRLAGPVFRSTIVHADNGEVPSMAAYAGGFAAAEAELLLHVPATFMGPMPQTNAEARSIVDAVHLGMEIASSPYVGINADGPLVTASDFGNNAGLVVGPALPDWREVDLTAILVSTEIDGVVVGEATAATMLDGPYGAVRFLLANLARRGIGWADGVWVSTGAITGVHPIAPGQSARARFGTFGQVDCRIVAARPV